MFHQTKNHLADCSDLKNDVSNGDLCFQLQFSNVLCPVKRDQNTSLKQNTFGYRIANQGRHALLGNVKVAVDYHSDASADPPFF